MGMHSRRRSQRLLRGEQYCTAVIDSFEHGVSTTGAPPLALLLDNPIASDMKQLSATPSGSTNSRTTARMACIEGLLAVPSNGTRAHGARGRPRIPERKPQHL